MLLSTGTVYGSTYHTVEPPIGIWLDMEDWVREVFGAPGIIWDARSPGKTPEPGCRWYQNNRKFWFKDLKDATMFILRWS